jgi:hypothetical protein
MKAFFFNLVVAFANLLIIANAKIGSWISLFVGTVSSGLDSLIRVLGGKVLYLIDADRHKHFSTVASQRDELVELSLLASANAVKEDALAKKLWMPSHTHALNAIANELQASCGWEHVKIHAYLKPLVEGIPGLNYASGDEPEGVPS